MAPIGTITTKLELDKTSISGPNDTVSGSITLEYRPSAISSGTGSELFGPLQLSIVLEGLMKLQVAENRTSHAYIWFYERRMVLQKQELVFDGPFRLPAGTKQVFGFSTLMRDGGGGRTVLPPTLRTRFDSAAVRQAGKHQGAAAAEYSVRVDVELPGIEVDVSPLTSPTVLQYEQAAEPSRDAFLPDFTESLKVQTYSLLPEHQRPSSLLSTTKALLSSTPRPISAFNVTCSRTPTTIAIGDSIRVDVRIQLDVQNSTAASAPEIVLAGDSYLEVLSRTEMYATNEKGVDSPHLDNTTSIAKLPIIDQIPSGVFAKSNDFSKTVVFSALGQDVPSSFSVEKLTRSYRTLLVLRFGVAGQVVGVKKKFAVRVVPARPPGVEGVVVEAGPSRRVVGEEEMLPSYAEARAG